MSHPQGAIRLLLIEDVAADAERALYQFRRAGIAFEARRVETGEALREALGQFRPDAVLSDFTLPQFDGMSALRICREQAPEIPFVFLSGTIGEERAVAALQAGASDYVLKENLTRLVPAVQRAIVDAGVRAERAREQAQIARLNRVLRMLKGVNDMVMRSRDRGELLNETCRLAISLGGYAMAIAVIRAGDVPAVKAVASHGLDTAMGAQLCAAIEASASPASSVAGPVLGTGREFVCNDIASGDGAGPFDALLQQAGLRSFVALPLSLDGEPVAALMLAARDPGQLGEEELGMLRDLAHSLSLGLQYVHRDTHMRFLAHFSPLTGLARRTLFCSRLREMLSQPDAQAPGQAVAVLDVRRLGAINDSFGRHTGDRLLRQVAETLKRHVRQPEHLAHFGGGTFAMLLEKPAGATRSWQAGIEQQAADIFGQPVLVDDLSIPVSVRIGCALHPQDAENATSLVQHAETALLAARACGEASARFDLALQTRSVDTLALEHRLRFALERNEFQLHYQPKVNVITRRIQGAEALLRWRDPEQGLVSPAAFLPVLESSGLIVEVGNWVVRQAARDCAQWRQQRMPPVRIAVNIAPAQLRLPHFEQLFMGAVRPWASRTWGLDIEITEGVLHEDGEAEVRKLERLRAQGVRIAIDDFGTGYSSLSRLSGLPVDTLKIDQRFVGQIVRNPTGASVVKTVIALAHAFNMTCVAEGVELQDELDLLWHLGCDQSQGYLHCMPLPADEFAKVLRHGKGVLIQPPEPAGEDDEMPEAEASAAY